MNNRITATTALASLLALTALPATAVPIDSRDKPFNQYSWVTTHNSYEKINQNGKELPQQLKDGVRGFMLDIYFKSQYTKPEDKIRVCHKDLACYGTLINQLKNEFVPFLRNNPNEVVTIFLESYVEFPQLKAVFDAVPELAEYSFDPKNFSGKEWPTLKEMADKNNRLVFMTASTKIVGDYPIGNKKITVLYDNDWMVENRWDTLGAVAVPLASAHNWSCPSRNDALPLKTQKVNQRTGKEWSRLFLMNQFHHWTSLTNDSAGFDNNLTYLLRRVDNCEVTPNFIGVNHYSSGEVERYTNALNNGGIYFYEGANADKKQDAVCVIPTKPGVVDMKGNGCENDEAQSLTLSGVSKGTRITLYDSPSGSTQDDHLIIDVKRDIGLNERVVLPNFQTNYSWSSFDTIYNRNNGLNGKISRITIGKTPTDFSDSSIAFYEGGNGTQNLDCVVPFASHHVVKMKNNSFGCSNDEIKSAKIVKAKAGASLSLYGHPDGKNDQGVTTIEILKDIKSPLNIPSFNTSFTNEYVRVVNYHHGIDGKISFAGLRGTK